MKIVKKLIKWLLIFILSIGLVGLILGFIYNEPLPEGKAGAEAEELADKMLQEVQKNKWDSIHYIQWTFPGNHHYLWNKQDNLVSVKWKDFHVVFDSKTSQGKVLEGNLEVNKPDVLQQAIDYFNNDSFWLLAYTKIKDQGTERKIVETEEGQGLLITYSSGGSTPGDSYLWYLDKNGLPYKWKMWVSIIPIGGIETTWTDWKMLYNGARVAANHETSLFSITLSNIQAADNLSDMGIEEDPFLVILNDN